MIHLIDKSRMGAKRSGGDERRRTGRIHPTPDERAVTPDERAVTADERAVTAASESADDSEQGLAMFVIFIGAVLIVTGAVALLALISSPWMLGVAFAIHVTMTAVVFLTILYVMASRAHKRAERDQTAPAEDPRRQPETERGATGRPSVAELPAKLGPARQRVLMVTDEDLAAANEVPEAIRALIAQAEVYVVAPTLTTRLQSLTGDVDHARTSAQARLRTVFDHMHANGLEPRGAVGDEDQVAAIADALSDFDADLMLLRLHAHGDGNENWREHRLPEQVRSRFDLPTIAFFFDGDGQVVGREKVGASSQA